ncbi:MAG: hypothetical protein ACFCVK_14300 [Acidimicrobiales bacterium]
MSVHEPLFERAHPHHHPPALAPVGPDDLVGEAVFRPARWNAAGYCVMCLEWSCQADQCRTLYADSVWAVCRYCDGSGYDRNAEVLCTCTSGLVELTHSEWVDKPLARPSRLNFAGFCGWCGDRWCNQPRCITLHRRSTWAPCTDCGGIGIDETSGQACVCSFGLTETTSR